MKQVIISLFLILVTAPLFAQSLPAETSTQKLGKVLFFLDPEAPFNQQPGSVHVSEVDPIFFCVQLNEQDPRFAHVFNALRGLEITLEGEGDPPQKLTGHTRLRNQGVRPNAQGCYIGQVKVPFGVPPGKYKISEIDLLLAPRQSVSLREELSEFAPLGEIEIDSPQHDLDPPILEKIITYTPSEALMHYGGNVASAKVRFRVVTSDSISGIQPDSFHVFFKVFLNGVLIDIVEPLCTPKLSNLYYNCRLYFSRAIPDLKAVTVKFVLDSISLSDRLGHALEINEIKRLKALFEGNLLTYTFRPGKIKKKTYMQLPNEKEDVKWPPVGSPHDEKYEY